MQINDTQSSCLPVLSGVPQGSVLGPLLFLIFINDLADAVSHSTVSLFADDTKLLLDVTESNSSVLQSDLSAISQWCTQWELKLNLDKCSLIRFSLSHLNSDTSYLIDNHAISISQEVSDLGIIVNNKLSFSPHYKSICSKAYQTLFMVRRTLRLTSAPVSIKKQIYLTLVRSKLTYCCQLWRPYLIKDITMPEHVQRRATKFITGDYESDYKSRLLKLDLLPLMHWYELQDLLCLIKCLQNQPENINIDHVKFVSSGTRRSNRTLQYNYTRTTAARHFFFNRVVRLWNALQPINIDLPFNSIKHHLIRTLWNRFKRNFDPSNICTYHSVCPCKIYTTLNVGAHITATNDTIHSKIIKLSVMVMTASSSAKHY